MDREGKVVWEADVQGRPADARRLESGNTLVALHQGGRVLELDAKGRTVWHIDNLAGPCGAQRLENGNTLVCEANAGRVTERDPDGKIVWSKEGFSNCWDAQRLANGNTLVADTNAVQEIDPKGEVVWQRHRRPGAGVPVLTRHPFAAETREHLAVIPRYPEGSRAGDTHFHPEIPRVVEPPSG